MTKKTKQLLALVYRPLLFLVFACAFLWLFPSDGAYFSPTEMRLTEPARHLTAVLVSETFNGVNVVNSGKTVRLVDNDTLRFVYENPPDGIPVRHLLFRYDNFCLTSVLLLSCFFLASSLLLPFVFLPSSMCLPFFA